MTRSLPCARISLALALLLAMASSARAASLNVFSLLVTGDPRIPSNLHIVTDPPFLTWDPTAILGNPNGWVPARQYLGIRTDEPYQSGNWAIQVFTDNTHWFDAGTTFNIPDIAPTSPPRLVTGPLTPDHLGYQTIKERDGTIVWVKSGLVSTDRRERVPLIWRLFGDLPFPDGRVPPITENPPGSACDFDGLQCEWFYFQDKGDVNMSDDPPTWNFATGDYYVTPLTRDGAAYSVCPPGTPGCTSRFPPTYSGGFTTQYLALAANFRNVTRQGYATTIFVELLEF